MLLDDVVCYVVSSSVGMMRLCVWWCSGVNGKVWVMKVILK